MKPLLHSLRDATHDKHRQLEASLDIPARIADREGYRRLLAGFHGLYVSLEARLAERPELQGFGYEISQRSKLAALREDLRELGMPADEIATLPTFQAPPFPDAAAALGAAYVLEGSTLGGQAILRLIASQGAERPLPSHFFNVYGPETRERWVSFQATLAALPLTEQNADSATRSACATFDQFSQWLS